MLGRGKVLKDKVCPLLLPMTECFGTNNQVTGWSGQGFIESAVQVRVKASRHCSGVRSLWFGFPFRANRTHLPGDRGRGRTGFHLNGRATTTACVEYTGVILVSVAGKLAATPPKKVMKENCVSVNGITKDKSRQKRI